MERRHARFPIDDFVVNGKYRHPLNEVQRESLGLEPVKRGAAQSDFYRVKVTLSVVRGKNGRPIVRRLKKRA